MIDRGSRRACVRAYWMAARTDQQRGRIDAAETGRGDR